MPAHLSTEDIKQQLHAVANELTEFCLSIEDEIFFFQPVDKWSAAQQVKHLITATNAARLAFTLPRFIVRWVAGKPNRQSRTYDELLAKYNLKLQQGGRAGGRFVPKPVSPEYGKEKLLNGFTNSMFKFARALNKWEDTGLDQYIAPHPLLGKITLRELCYFTIFHTHHHLNSIKERIQEHPTLKP
jgi:hypothetical protein